MKVLVLERGLVLGDALRKGYVTVWCKFQESQREGEIAIFGCCLYDYINTIHLTMFSYLHFVHYFHFLLSFSILLY